MQAIKFVVFGTPQPQGSSRAFYVKKLGRSVITTDNSKLKPWRQQVSGVIENAKQREKLQSFGPDVPVQCQVDCYFIRPKSATVKKRPGMTVKPDGDKLLRAIYDALTSSEIIDDDAQIVDGRIRKFYNGPERVEIILTDARIQTEAE